MPLTLLLSLIHPSAWKWNSPKFACTDSKKDASRSKGSSYRMWVAEPETTGAAVDLVNAILPYSMAGAFFFWLIAEDREGRPRSRVLSLVSAVILALLFAGEDRDYHWWISGFVLVGLATEGIALATALLGLVIPSPPP